MNFTHVIHAATDSAIGPRLAPLDCYYQILDGTRNILDLAVSAGASRFLYISSGAVYGPQSIHLTAIPETFPGSPPLNDIGSVYGNAKRAAEHICSLVSDEYGLDIVIARCFSFSGPDLPRNVHFAIGNFIQDALYNDSIIVKGDGSPLRTYLHQSDLARWLFTLLFEGKPGNVFNVGSDEVISISELAFLVRDVLSPGKPVKFLSQENRSISRNVYVPDVSRAFRELDLKVDVNLADSIRLSAL